MRKKSFKKIITSSSFILLNLIIVFALISLIKRKIPFEVLMEEAFVPANIVVYTDREANIINPLWRALAQGGEETNTRMLASTVNIVKGLKPAYIRIDHIYDDDYYGVVKARSNNGSFILDWSKLDATVNDILATGAKPFFSLSYMPSLLADSKIDAPYYWRDWQELVRLTVEHYSQRIPDVYYEVWNEPSLKSFGNWRMYGGKDYRQLYYYAVMGAYQAKINYNYKIGGPAIPELDINWIKFLFDYVRENNLRLDFVSWHRYGLDVDRYLKDVEEIDLLTNSNEYSQFKTVEKIISEYGPDSEKTAVYLGPQAAVHLVALTRKLMGKVNFIFTFEIKDGPWEESVGWGLLNHESLGLRRTPRFYALQWLADFEGRRLELVGEGSQISGFAVKNGNKIRVILTNYSDSQSKEESFHMVLVGLKTGQTYRLLRQTLFDLPNTTNIEVRNETLVLNLTMAPYSVVKIELEEL